MPEAPEVEALTLFLRERLVGRRVQGVELLEFRAVKTPARPLDSLVGATVVAVSRYGKHIDVDLGTAHLSIGFGRAGWATWTDAAAGTAASMEEDTAEAAVIARIAATGLSETAFLMFFFAGFALAVALVFALYARRYPMQDHYRAAGALH